MRKPILILIILTIVFLTTLAVYRGLTPYVPEDNLVIKRDGLTITISKDGKITNLAMKKNLYDAIQEISIAIDKDHFNAHKIVSKNAGFEFIGTAGDRDVKVDGAVQGNQLVIRMITKGGKSARLIITPSEFSPVIIRKRGEQYIQARHVAYGIFSEGSLSLFTGGKLLIVSRKPKENLGEKIFTFKIVLAEDVDSIMREINGCKTAIKRLVVDESGKPVKGAKILLKNPKVIVDVSTSDDSGYVTFCLKPEKIEFGHLYFDEISVKSADKEKIVLNIPKKLYFRWKPYLTDLRKDGVNIAMRLSRPEKVKVTVNGKEFTDDVIDTFHSIRIYGLKPGKLYKAEVSAGALGYSMSFETLGREIFKFLVYGDTRTNFEWHKLVASEMAKEGAPFVLHTGDLVESGDLITDWDKFFEAASALYSKSAIFPTLGNHERNADYYYQAFMSHTGGGNFLRRWYSFDAGNIHFIAIDSNISPETSLYKQQKNWLIEDLKNTKKKYKIVYFHHPFFTNSPYREPSYREDLEELFVKMGVDVVFNGHIHHYERFLKNGVMYVTTGGGGAPLGFGLKSKNRLHLPYTEAGKAGFLHYVVCEVKEDGLHFTVKAVAKYDWGKLYKHKEIIDSFVIKK